MPKLNTIEEVLAFLLSEIAKEERGLRDISGPSGMRNSQASAMGLARNSVRQELVEMLSDESEGR